MASGWKQHKQEKVTPKVVAGGSGVETLVHESRLSPARDTTHVANLHGNPICGKRQGSGARWGVRFATLEEARLVPLVPGFPPRLEPPFGWCPKCWTATVAFLREGRDDG